MKLIFHDVYKAGHSSVLHSVPFAPRLVFLHPFESKNEGRHLRRLQSALPPLFNPPYFSSFIRRISDFLASSRGPNLGRSFDVPLPSHRGPKLESAHEVLDFEFVGIPALPFRYANFHQFLKLSIAFSFPCSRNSILEEM
ncbi:hypothetical protein AVEN_53623-1 [Araneus ventricosus]|uniref:Uncharacterized protein n=1 Tax=Araneus ventricosus TaxID=182803 RepID=A0A4Y2C6Q7_ARAVE|nr:hypothetical protein AVEN_53623-1 [Araneus ventricosus]